MKMRFCRHVARLRRCVCTGPEGHDVSEFRALVILKLVVNLLLVVVVGVVCMCTCLIVRHFRCLAAYGSNDKLRLIYFCLNLGLNLVTDSLH